MTSETTTRRTGRAMTAVALALALVSSPVTTSGRADAVAAHRARPATGAPTLAGAYVGGVHLGLGGATQLWPVFEPFLRHGVVGRTYGTVATDSRHPGWLGNQSHAALRVRGLGTRDAATYPLTFYDCTAAPRAITPCAIAYTR